MELGYWKVFIYWLRNHYFSEIEQGQKQPYVTFNVTYGNKKWYKRGVGRLKNYSNNMYFIDLQYLEVLKVVCFSPAIHIIFFCNLTLILIQPHLGSCSQKNFEKLNCWVDPHAVETLSAKKRASTLSELRISIRAFMKRWKWFSGEKSIFLMSLHSMWHIMAIRANHSILSSEDGGVVD
jgi:hypothetical protein